MNKIFSLSVATMAVMEIRWIEINKLQPCHLRQMHMYILNELYSTVQNRSHMNLSIHYTKYFPTQQEISYYS